MRAKMSLSSSSPPPLAAAPPAGADTVSHDGEEFSDRLPVSRLALPHAVPQKRHCARRKGQYSGELPRPRPFHPPLATVPTRRSRRDRFSCRTPVRRRPLAVRRPRSRSRTAARKASKVAGSPRKPLKIKKPLVHFLSKKPRK
uniref:Uncharacterized protein n=1 Tax=Corethron hystrix TaxID=216773 RepID=A0A7S1G2A4_9STRA|mmetsp:Transcript_9914/g.22126  ORF Transcript_9914/g.22126 Transcript_9914/m.22126 type:complete len:143 (+) Transcript_9914:543-971(+)